MGTISTRQAAERLSEALGRPVSNRLVRLWAEKGRIAAIRTPGGRWCVEESAVMEIEEERRRQRQPA